MDKTDLELLIRWRLAVIAYGNGFIGPKELIENDDKIVSNCLKHVEELERRENEETLGSKLDSK